MSKVKFKGVIPALVTPLNEDESINCTVLKDLIEDMISDGADGFYIAGATGEGIALRPAERRILTEEAIRITNHRKPCIVQVASTDFGEAIELAKHAERCGADAISATPPLFFHYDEDDVYNYYKAFANAVHIPLMIYYNPAAGFTVNSKFAARTFEIDNVTSIKWTSQNYFQMMELKDFTHGEMNIINGCDETLLMGLNAGADGGIGTTYNFMLDLIKGVYDSYMAHKQDKACEYQEKVVKIVSALLQYSIIPATKVLMEAMGYKVGNAMFPMKRYSEEEKRNIVSSLIAAGLNLKSR